MNKEEQGAGPLYDVATHALDTLLYIMDNYSPKSVLGVTHDKLKNLPDAANPFGMWDPEKYTVEDSAFGLVTMKNGASIIIETSWLINAVVDEGVRYSVCGTRAGLDNYGGKLKVNSVKHGKKIIVMEPVKGGALVNLPPPAAAEFEKLGDAAPVSYALRYAASFPEVFMVLSGMGNMEMMESNIRTMHPFVPLNDAELAATDKAREIIRQYNQIPCTKCRYCAEVCPKNVPIADLFAVYNEYALAKVTKKETKAGLNSFDVKAGDCIECGKCEKICPQNIEIRENLKKLKKLSGA
jgi:ferredoxin